MSRYAEIGRVLARHGWRSALAYLGLERGLRRREVTVERAEELFPPAAVREILSDLGPTYVKIGQILSTRPDLVPEPYVRELEKLQDSAPPIPSRDVDRVIEDALGRPAGQAFHSFTAEPLAAASIGQVHAARFQGRDVVVKVRRPGIQHKVEADLDIITGLARRLEHTLPIARKYNVSAVIRDLATFVRAELDFVNEGRNADTLRRSMSGVPFVRVPRIEWSASTSRVLVMERLEGVKATDAEGLRRLNIDRPLVARRIAETMIRQVFVNGLFHGDPHPGNIMVGAGGTIGFLDCGNVTALDSYTRARLLEMLLAMHRCDSAGFADSLLELSVGAEETDRRLFIHDVDVMLRSYLSGAPGQGRIGRVMRGAMQLVWRHGLMLSAEVGVLVKACLQFEGVCRRLDPDFEVLDLVDGLMLGGLATQLVSRDTAAAAVAAANDLVRLGLEAPRSLGRLVSKAAHGQFTTNVHHRGLDQFAEHLDKIANRLAYSLLVSASIIGSSLLLRAGIGPLAWGLPVLSLAAFGVSAGLAGVLLWNILASGRLR